MSGLIGRKIGMTRLPDEAGNYVSCTVVQAGPCVVTQVKTKEIDGYTAIQLGFEEHSKIKADIQLPPKAIVQTPKDSPDGQMTIG